MNFRFDDTTGVSDNLGGVIGVFMPLGAYQILTKGEIQSCTILTKLRHVFNGGRRRRSCEFSKRGSLRRSVFPPPQSGQELLDHSKRQSSFFCRESYHNCEKLTKEQILKMQFAKTMLLYKRE